MVLSVPLSVPAVVPGLFALGEPSCKPVAPATAVYCKLTNYWQGLRCSLQQQSQEEQGLETRLCPGRRSPACRPEAVDTAQVPRGPRLLSALRLWARLRFQADEMALSLLAKPIMGQPWALASDLPQAQP